MEIKNLDDCKLILDNKDSELPIKYKCLFYLKNINNEESVKLLINSYKNIGDSELLNHEIMYVWGQMNQPICIDFLIEVLNNENEFPVVRHEAGEALANYPNFSEKILPHLKNQYNSPHSLVKSTVRIAIEKLINYTNKSNYGEKYNGTWEPAEPFSLEDLENFIKKYFNLKNIDNLEVLIEKLLLDDDDKVTEYIKYRILYFIRNFPNSNKISILGKLLRKEFRKNTSPLFRHELCFVLGQLSESCLHIMTDLKSICDDLEEFPVVRHEAVLAASEILGDKNFLEPYTNDKEKIVAESAQLVLKEL